MLGLRLALRRAGEGGDERAGRWGREAAVAAGEGERGGGGVSP